jgi:chromate transporter
LSDLASKPRPGLWQLFTTWFLVGIQSFGGGSSTLILIQRACVRRGWLDEGEFVRLWALVQIAPGINLIKLTILIGHRLRGWPGLLSASAGLLLPSASATVLMTAGFTAISGQPLVKAAMRGILPAAIGLSLAMAVQMAQPVFTQARKEGRLRLGLHLAILLGAALLMAVNGVSPLVVLLAAGVVGVLLFTLFPVKPGTLANRADQETL